MRLFLSVDDWAVSSLESIKRTMRISVDERFVSFRRPGRSFAKRIYWSLKFSFSIVLGADFVLF